MSTDTNDREDDDRMEKIDVRVPAPLLERIDEAYPERGYSSRSEAIRDALRDWADPHAELSEALLADLARSREQAERGDTTGADEVRERLGLED